MKKILFLLFIPVSLIGQWVRPNQFPELDTINDANFEVYSQRYGVNKKASMTTIKKFMDQNITLSGDSICITRASGTQCVKIPSQAFSQASQVFSVTSNGASYTLPEDTIVKYDYVFLKYEANTATSNYDVVLPEPSISYNGKIVDVYLHLSSSSGLSAANISSPNSGIQTNDGSSPINQTNYLTGAGLYRFVCTKSINASGYKWLLISKPGSAIQSKRVNSIVASNQVYNMISSDLFSIDELSIYVVSTGFDSQIGIPQPDSTKLGKTIFLYPTNGSANLGTVATTTGGLIKFTGPGSLTYTSLLLTEAAKLTCINYNGAYYWDFRNLYDGNSGGSTGTSYFTKVIDLQGENYSLPADTVSKYNRIYITETASGFRSITLPDPTIHTGKEVIINPILSPGYNTTVLGSIAEIGNYSTPYYYGTANIYTKAIFTSDGNNWVLHRPITDIVTSKYILGRYSSYDGPVQEVNLGSGFSWNGNTLNVSTGSSGGYSLKSLTLSTGGVAVISYTGTSAPTITGSAGAYTINVPSGTSINSYTISADTDDCAIDGSIDIKVSWASLPGNINSSKDNVFLPSVTVTEKATTFNVQQADYYGWQITHPLIASNAVTTRITGINGFSAFIIKGIF